MGNLVNILLALVVFSLIILFHEFGHFILAKYNKVRVIEFSLGMGPRIISFAKSKDGSKHLMFFKSNSFFEEHTEFENNTIYSWKILPFGGSCMMLGEENESEDERSFCKKGVLARFAIIFAGPFFNFILAFVLSMIVVISVGYDSPTITGIEAGSPIMQAGLKEGDVITAVNGEAINVTGEFGYYKLFNPFSDKTKLSLSYERDGKSNTVDVVPKAYKDENGNVDYRLGFSYGVRKKANFVQTIYHSAYNVKYWISVTLQSLWHMIKGEVSLKDISGPVGIVQTVGKVVDQSKSEGVKAVTVNLINISILLTANLGVMNLIPIPALDGGRLLLLIIEAIRRKKNNPKIENAINTVGFVLLMLLMVVILFNDVWKIFS